MKKEIFLFVLFVPHLLFANSELDCSPLNDLSENLQDVQDVNCEQINKDGMCKEAAPVDENALRNKITNLLKISEDPARIERLQKNWAAETKQNPWIVKMYADRSQYEIQEKLKPEPIISWFANTTFAPDAKSQEEYKKSFIDKYVAFAKKMDCAPTFRASPNYIENHPTVKGFDAKNMGRDEKEARLRQLRDEIKDAKNIKAAEDHIKELNAKSKDSFFICNNKPDLDQNGNPPARYISAQKYPPCAGNFKKNFENNKYDVSQPELEKLLKTPEAEELSACIKDRLAKGAKLHHVSINSSASSLNNTGDAEKRFCRKGFLGLSEARAQTAKDKILPGLFTKAGQGNMNMSSVKVEVNAGGANGDGTSGPCVYEMKNGREVLKPYYNTDAGRAELDENRYVKVQVTFDEQVQSVSNNVPNYRPVYRCKKIEFKCDASGAN